MELAVRANPSLVDLVVRPIERRPGQVVVRRHQGRLPVQAALLDRTTHSQGLDVDPSAGQIDQIAAAELDHAETPVGVGDHESLLR